MKIKYVVKEYIEENCFHKQTRYGIYDVKAKSSAWTTSPHNGLVFLFDNKEYAEIVCHFINLDCQD